MKPIKKKIHLICNAHLDPAWLWEWQEGAGEALSTFRTAAELCEKDGTFVFNHNEVILYNWISLYEPALFRRIQKLVKKGRWHIMSGWYLQPDCNMPSGESFVRQILLGRNYFKKHFGVEPATAVNFDPFGHSRGLVQILAKSGYDSYLFCRPGPADVILPADDFIWTGFDGSRILAHRLLTSYCTQPGCARQEIEKYITEYGRKEMSIVCWGVGNHGGGPSRKDLNQVNDLIKKIKGFTVIHSTPEAYFTDIRKKTAAFPSYNKDLNRWAVGCYTSMAQIKQKHRLLENELYMAEKMVSAAMVNGLMDYPEEQLHEAFCDLMLAEFHDILPGEGIELVEEAGLKLLGHGLEITSRIKAKAFFALASGQKKAKAGKTPILVYNPHPFKIKQIVECEFQLPNQLPYGQFADVSVTQNGCNVNAQVERQSSNIEHDWRKRAVFIAELKPGQMNRFDCSYEILAQKPQPKLKSQKNRIIFRTPHLYVVINTRTGLIDKYGVDGIDYLCPEAFKPVIMWDDEDPWGAKVTRFNKLSGGFKLMASAKAAEFACVRAQVLAPVRVIEDGPVRSVVESLLKNSNSFICLRYKLPKTGTEIEIEIRVHWNHNCRMLKLALPLKEQEYEYIGQVAYGADKLPADGTEVVSHKWVAAVSRKNDMAITCINDGIYGSDFLNNTIRLSLLRSPLYAAWLPSREDVILRDRYRPRIDQGVRTFKFWFNAGNVKARLDAIDREALTKNEKPFALPFSVPGQGSKPKTLAILSDDVIQITAIKKAENNGDLILRLYEPTGIARNTVLSLPFAKARISMKFKAFEIKTLRFNEKKHKLVETDLIEKELR